MFSPMTCTLDSRSRYAFFDVDGTLLRVKSMFDFQAHRFGRSSHLVQKLQYRATRARFGLYALAGRSRSYMNRRYYETFRGAPAADVRRAAEEWFLERTAALGSMFIAPAIDVLQAHRRAGAGIVLVSGSFEALLLPVARALGGADILATRLETIDGIYTGNILAPQMIGAGKSEAVRAYLRDRGARASDCFAYGDHWSDLAMLRTVGRPGVVAGDARLETYARRNGWPVITET